MLLKAFLTRAFFDCFHECAIFPALVTLNIDSFPRLEIFCKVIHVFRCACSENTVIFHLIGILKKSKERWSNVICICCQGKYPIVHVFVFNVCKIILSPKWLKFFGYKV